MNTWTPPTPIYAVIDTVVNELGRLAPSHETLVSDIAGEFSLEISVLNQKYDQPDRFQERIIITHDPAELKRNAGLERALRHCLKFASDGYRNNDREDFREIGGVCQSALGIKSWPEALSQELTKEDKARIKDLEKRVAELESENKSLHEEMRPGRYDWPPQ